MILTQVFVFSKKQKEIKFKASRFRRPVGVGALLLAAFLILFPAFVEGQIRAPSSLEREEASTTSPFSHYRERSSQKLTFNHHNPYVTSELDFRYITFKYDPYTNSRENRLYQASLTGQNLSSPLFCQAGRIWTGNDIFRPVDGVGWRYLFGKRLSGALQLGKIPNLNLDSKYAAPAYAEGRLQYRFNDAAFLAWQSSQEFEDHFSSVLLGYSIESLKALGEYRSTGATDSYRLSLQYYDTRWADLTSDYRVNMHNGQNSGIMRHTLGMGGKNLHFEAGGGSKFFFGTGNIPQSNFYEGTLSYGSPRKAKDNVSIGYLVEIEPASEARTVTGSAERVVTADTRLGLSMADTRFDKGKTSVQNLEGRLHRRVEWGFYELALALITAGDDSKMQKDVRLRAGYEF